VTLLFCCAAVMLASVAPGWRSGRRRLPAVGLRTTQGRPATRVRTALVGAQIALAVVLLAGAALVGRSVLRLTRVSPGFELHGLLTARLSLPGARYANADATRAAVDRILERIRAVPGVTAAGAIDQIALSGSGSTGDFAVAGRAPSSGASSTALIRSVTPGYFAAMGIPALEGRRLEASDTTGSPKVVIVNRTLAVGFFSERPAMGERIVFEFFDGRPAWTIVGVVGDEQFNDLDRPMVPVVYFPFAQSAANSFSVVVRAAQPGAVMRDPLRAAVASIDPELPLYGMRSMEQMVSESTPMFLRAIVMRLLAWFSIAALMLGGVGVYGVLSEAMTSRTREIGVRMALGATRARIGRLVLRAGATPAVLGLAAGAALTAAAAPALRSLLFGVTLLDLPSFAAVFALLAGVTLAACAIPAWRAVRLPVTTALRTE
jgi:putative ABC transport system permease protein